MAAQTLEEQIANAESGDAEAQFNLGYNYFHGANDVPQDYAQAVRWYQAAAEQNHPKAICNLGFCYDGGSGVEKDEVKAVELYRKAAELGDIVAQFNLGYDYYHGEGVEMDYE